jgi:opacity protein-like surface antigen
MKTVFAALLCALLLGCTFISNAQSLRIGIGGGYASLNGPSALAKDISNNGAGLKNGYEIGGKLKLDFPLLPFRLTGQAYYMDISNSGSMKVIPGASLNPVNVNVETSMTMFSAGAGFEYDLIPGPISPYFALDLLYTSFGDVKTTYNPSTSGLSSLDANKPYSNKSKFGLGIGIGSEFTLLPVIDLDLNVKYNLMNLMGKEDMKINGINYKEESVNTLTVTANILFGL